MKEQLQSIEARAKEELSSISDIKLLEDFRVRYLGKKGELTAILKQMGKLTPEEFNIMKGHTINCAQMLNAVPIGKDERLMKYAYEICRWHHERFDGRGYPDGLKGDEIPLCARIMAVADVYDALVSKRPYKDPLPHEVAVAEVLKGKGKQFDPDVVEAFAGIADTLPALYQKFKDEGI